MSSNLLKNQFTTTVLKKSYNYFFSQINYKVVDKTGRETFGILCKQYCTYGFNLCCFVLHCIINYNFLQTQSDLLGLIQVMICTFGEQPPVYAKPKNETPPQATPYPTQCTYYLLLNISGFLHNSRLY